MLEAKSVLLFGRIPRDEVEEIGRIIHEELNAIEPGCISTIVGGCAVVESCI